MKGVRKSLRQGSVELQPGSHGVIKIDTLITTLRLGLYIYKLKGKQSKTNPQRKNSDFYGKFKV